MPQKTDSREQLAVLRSIADAFFNTVQEDNYLTADFVAEACGTTVVTYDIGGCVEAIKLPCSKSHPRALLTAPYK